MKTLIYKIIIVSIILVSHSLIIEAQHTISLHKKVNWLESTYKSSYGEEERINLNFSNNGYINSETLLPIIYEALELPPNVDISSIKVSICDESFKWPTPEEHVSLKDSINFDTIPLEYHISKDKNKNILDISLTPVLRKPTEPTFKKLDRFSILVDYQTLDLSQLKVAALKQNTYASNSVLKDGKWVKVKISKTGIHKISYSELQNMGFSSPSKVNVYGNGGKMLAKKNSDFRYDDLAMNSIWHYNNAIYFYAQSTDTWEYIESEGTFMHEMHDYTSDAIYFLSDKSNSINTIKASDEQNGTKTVDVDYFNDYQFFETNEHNLIKSGIEWFGERFTYYGTLSYDFNFAFDNIRTTDKAKVYTQLAARSTTISYFELNYNNNALTTIAIPTITTDNGEGHFAQMKYDSAPFTPESSNITIKIAFDTRGSTSAIGYLDYVGINANRELIQTGNQMLFRNKDIIANNQIAEYKLKSTSSETVIWDITEPTQSKLVNHTQNNSTSTFKYNASSLKQFVSFNPNQTLSSVTYVEEVNNQDLHSSDPADYIIVTHPDFIEQANRLAKIHEEHSRLSTLVVTPQEIYNEFSSGQPDVAAIRDFMKMLYNKAGDNSNESPKYLLLFGDGSYNNQNVNTSKIITYQSLESLEVRKSYVSDDFFGFLDDEEGLNVESDKLDIGIGRFPVNTIEEATNAVDKTESYITNQSRTTWKTMLTFLADDGDENLHMEDADIINSEVSKQNPEFNINKIYFDAYPRVSTTAGYRYPRVEEEINNAIQKGTLVFNYTGHGGSEGLSEERVITKESINKWSNVNTLPLFMTATCEFSRYDEEGETTAGEMVFLNPVGGAIALFTTTRIAYTGPNKEINTNFYKNIFEKDESNNKLRFGEVIRRTKNLSQNYYKMNFTLLGDPALQLNYPEFDAVPQSVNDTAIIFNSTKQNIDTIRALSHNKIDGNIQRYADNVASGNKDTIIVDDFFGELDITIFDKPQKITCLGQNSSSKFEFQSYNSSIYKGKSSVNNGYFTSEFIAPKDIKYNYDYGKISYYANSEDSEAFGAFSQIVVGGIDESAIDDGQGPTINIYLNNRNFRSGDETTPAPLLLIDLYDESGINTTGSGIGHDITCVIDEDITQPITLNNFYTGKLDSYQKGTVEYNLPRLTVGQHTLTIKAWDSFNNSSNKTITFFVSADKSMQLDNNKFFPNPTISGAEAYFSFEHDEPNLTLNVEINIYTLNGQLINKQNKTVVSLGNTVPPISWKANYTNGKPLNTGIYIYQLIIKSETGREGKLSGKIMVTQ